MPTDEEIAVAFINGRGKRGATVDEIQSCLNQCRGYIGIVKCIQRAVEGRLTMDLADDGDLQFSNAV